MSDWIPVILLKRSEPRRPRADEEPSKAHEIDVINALMHRRHIERISNREVTLPQTTGGSADDASGEVRQTPSMLLSPFEALFSGNQCDAEGECWVVTLSRRRNIDGGPKAQLALLPECVHFGPYCYRSQPPRVEAGGKAATLTRSEAGLLEALLRRAGQVLDRAELLSAVAPLQSDERTVDRAVCRLRRKLSAVDEPHANILRTARMRGYVILVGNDDNLFMG